MLSKFIKPVVCLTLLAGLTACNPTLRSHGFIVDKVKPQEVEANVDTRATVLTRVGNPSIKSTFDDEKTWYYLSSVRENLAYLKPQLNNRTITAIRFNDDGQVTEVAEYGIEDGRYVNYSDRKTPTRGREVSFLEQIFGSVGRLPTQTLGGQEQTPGGRGERR